MGRENKGGTCYLVGHAHIDAAWRWRREETLRVCYDTFSSVLRLMDSYPDFRFAQGSAQYYEWMEEHYPSLFAKIKERIREGRWEVVGGMWVEPDCNLPSGESLVRQLLHGKRYFKEKLGVDVQVAWLPDTFGFPWTLPQLLVKAGIRYFLTAKLNYKASLPFPYNLFWWVAPDGSRVLACQTVGGYDEREEDLTPEALGKKLLQLRRRHGIDELLVVYGRGDHGGGPTEEMLERAHRLSRERRSPRVVFSTAEGYFKRLEQMTHSSHKGLPQVEEELYLKTHRGTYTTQAKVKWNNRRAEHLLEAAEKFSAIAGALGGYTYPREGLHRAWRKLLFNQFHDILAGSSIPQVYEDSERDFREIFALGEGALKEALKAIARSVDTRAGGDGGGEGHPIPILVFNPLSWERTGPVELDLGQIPSLKGQGRAKLKILGPDGRELPFQLTDDRKLIFAAEGVPPLGYKLFRAVPAGSKGKGSNPAASSLEAREDEEEIVLENEFLRVVIDRASGLLLSLYDKWGGREVLEGKGNLLQIYEDGPSIDDAWDINLGRLTELDRALEARLIERGPVRATARIRHVYRQEGRPDSRFQVEVALWRGLPWVEFHLKADWHAAHRLAKVAFQMNLRSEWATYEIPYGAIRRRDPASPQASAHERAKWEVPAQRWVDYTDESGEFGVSLLNDCKYGFDVQGNLLRMTLLRSPHHPDPLENPPEQPPLTDQGKHTIRYALYPHRGDWRAAGTPNRGYEFNLPLLVWVEPPHPGKLPRSASFIRVEPSSVILSALKAAEDSDSDSDNELILRVYESTGRATQARIELNSELLRGPTSVSAWEADLLERELRELSPEGDGGNGKCRLPVELAPFEVKTLKLRLG